MKEWNTYQETVKTALSMAKSMGADSSEVGLISSTGLNVTVRMQEVDVLEFSQNKSFGITVYTNHRKGSASTTDLHPEALQKTVEAAINLARVTEPDPFAGLANSDEMATDLRDLQLYYPWEQNVEAAIQLAKDCEQAALSYDKKITNSDGGSISTGQCYRVYGNSHGFIGAFPSTRHSLSCTAIAEDLSSGSMERDGEYSVARRFEDLAAPEIIGKKAAALAMSRLQARKIATQKVPVLFQAKVAASLWAHFLGAISGGRLFRKTSFLEDSLGKTCFPAYINLHEEPHMQSGLYSTMFDDDGVGTRAKHFVKNGVIESYLLSAYSARKLHLPNTGNAGGVHNLIVSHSEKSFEDLVKTLQKGLIVTEVMGMGINLVTGDYSRGASGFWVENGEIQYPVNEITIAGKLQDIFKHCVAVGNDIDYRHNIRTGSVLIEEMMVAGEG